MPSGRRLPAVGRVRQSAYLIVGDQIEPVKPRLRLACSGGRELLQAAKCIAPPLASQRSVKIAGAGNLSNTTILHYRFYDRASCRESLGE